MSGMRSAARGLVQTRIESFESRHPEEASKRRLEQALARVPVRQTGLETRWESREGRTVLVAKFAPSPKTQRFLKALSLGMALLVAASLWALVSAEASGSTAFLLPMITVLAVLGFPLLVLGLASQREADESRIRKAIRVALLDEDEGFPPARRWDDEED
jgi:hypothetical protein